jgi:hypothetical protein
MLRQKNPPMIESLASGTLEDLNDCGRVTAYGVVWTAGPVAGGSSSRQISASPTARELSVTTYSEHETALV